MTLQEIAKPANVSIATVSRIVHRVPTVNPALARRVQKVIEREGYYPNTQARALFSGPQSLVRSNCGTHGPRFPGDYPNIWKTRRGAQLRNPAESDDPGSSLAGDSSSPDDRA